jgi:AcrR family transcriptional regulator
VDEVAERAGYTKGAVYSNFASKEDLFFAVYERRVEQALTEVVPALRQAGAERAFDWVATGTIERRRQPLTTTSSRLACPSRWTRCPRQRRVVP